MPNRYNEPTGARPGWCYLVGAGPGDPDLITVRGAELVASADVVLHDELIDPGALVRARHDVELRAVGRRGTDPASKQARQEAIIADLIALARAGKRVVRLKGGDPFLFGRGGEEAEALQAAGVPFEIVPGVCSPLGATAYAGVPLTHRELASSVAFVTAVRRDGSEFDWRELEGLTGTLCVFMGARRVDRICAALIAEAGRSPSTPAAVVSRASHPRQRTVSGTLETLPAMVASAGPEPPALLLVGEVVGLRDRVRWFDRQPLFGLRALVTRAAHQSGPTARLLRQRGAEPIAFPTIAIEPPPDPARVARAVEDLARGQYGLVIFTSENTVRWLWRELDRQGRDARVFGGATVAAIGPATAAGLARRGVKADLVADTYVAESLAEKILSELPRRDGLRALLPRALVAREVLPEQLEAAGIAVDVVPVYRTVTASPERAEELRALLPSLDLVLLTSSSTAEKLCSLLGPEAPRLLAHATVASIGPITTATAERLGLRVAVTASVSTSAGLVDALEAAFAASE